MVSSRETLADLSSDGKAGSAARAIDERVGQNIRVARIEAGISQMALAWELGKTFQQVQKYERAANRVSAGVLGLIAKITGKSVAWFYEESKDAAPQAPTEDFMAALKLARRIADLSPAERRALHGVIAAMKRKDEGEEF